MLQGVSFGMEASVIRNKQGPPLCAAPPYGNLAPRPLAASSSLPSLLPPVRDATQIISNQIPVSSIPFLSGVNFHGIPENSQAPLSKYSVYIDSVGSSPILRLANICFSSACPHHDLVPRVAVTIDTPLHYCATPGPA